MTDGEIKRSFARIEQSLKNADDRHADLAGKMVPTALWQAEHEALERNVAELRDDWRQAVDRAERTSLERRAVLDAKIDALVKRADEHEKAHAERSAWTRSRTLQAIGIAVTAAAAIAAAWIGAILAAKGVH
jgi:hypothetical protein